MMNTIKIGKCERDICGRFYPIILNGKWVNEIQEYDMKHVNIKWKVLGNCYRYLSDAKRDAINYYRETETFGA